MSISSSLYADYAEKIRKEWVRRLNEAYREKNWSKVTLLMLEMAKFRFSE